MISRISRDTLHRMMERGEDFILIDTLPETIFRKSHLPGAINIVSDEIVTAVPHQIPDREATIVVYCANGPCRRSDLAAERLTVLGYRNVLDYHEGKADWIEAGLLVETA
ncbi:MAG: rhodanese-like domain-containing protein [Betaproteobacteria bacterium]|nr:rhodanese-like domain-containing protein [Betaproteobacteria bacterium]